MTTWHRMAVMTLAAGLAGAPLPGMSGSLQWNGTTGDWCDPAKWGGAVPHDGDDVVLPAGSYTCTLTGETANLNSYLQNGGTLSFSNWNTTLAAVTVMVASGTVTHYTNTDMEPGDDWTPDGRVLIVCSNFFLDARGKINVDGRGYKGGFDTNGCGPGGGGIGGNIDRGGGGGYGGPGGPGESGFGGAEYGAMTAPCDPGSGGGSKGGGSSWGGAGGGLVQILADDMVVINGSISANGAGPHNCCGAGAGGGVYIICKTLTGTNGSIRAMGGNGFNSAIGCGAGGRIAVHYDQAAQSNLNLTAKPTVRFCAKNGYHNSVDQYRQGSPGTLWFPDLSVLSSDLMEGARIVVPANSWSVESLITSNGVLIFTNGFQLTVAGDMTVKGDGYSWWRDSDVLVLTNQLGLQVGGNVLLDGGILRFYSVPDGTSMVAIAGGLTLTNAGKLYLHSGMKPAGSDAPGILVSVSNDMAITSSNSWVYPYSHRTNGGSVFFKMKNLSITHTNSGFDASGKGYGRGDTPANYTGYGPGGASPGTSVRGGGGSYGGIGGALSIYLPGPVYGSSNAPVEPGSGSSDADSSGGGDGGGLVWVEAFRDAFISGTMNANSGAGGNCQSTGSGGGIYVRCRNLYGGDATLTAKAGSCSGDAAAGGGGRIAVWCVQNRADIGTWYVDAGGGTNTNYQGSRYGAVGSVVWGVIPAGGTFFKMW